MAVAVLVLENPWWNPIADRRSTSIRHFLDATARLHDNLNIYYSTFFDARGLDIAMAQYLRDTAEKRQIIYLAAHGNPEGMADIGLKQLCEFIGRNARLAPGNPRVEGLIISSCGVGLDLAPQDFMRGTTLRWAFAYTHAVNWLDSMLIELKVLTELSKVWPHQHGDLNVFTNAFQRALGLFSPIFHLGAPPADAGRNNVELKDCFRIFIRPAGRGNHTLEYTQYIRETLGWAPPPNQA